MQHIFLSSIVAMASQDGETCRVWGQHAAFSIVDVLWVPFVPRSFNVWTLEKVADLVTEIRTANPALRASMFLNRADPRGQDNEDAAEVLKEQRRWGTARPSAMPRRRGRQSRTQAPRP